MKKLITLSMLLVMSAVGIIFGYKSVKINDILEENNIKIPFLQDSQPVTGNVMTISKPYKDNNVKIAVEFYNPTKANQEKSIIVIDKTFIPNKGVLYQNEKSFDVLAIYNGTVLDVGKDDLTGNYVKINHDNNLIGTYKILGELNVKKGDYVKKGDKISTSGTSNIAKNNLLLFELQSKEVPVNPEDYYNKTIKEI